MLKERTIHVVVVKKDHGTGIDITEGFDKVVKYRGEEILVTL
jgi:CMP-2-keto-3-deoxyoctulosonic acid synthetase